MPASPTNASASPTAAAAGTAVSAYATASLLAPHHTAATVALVRGGMCAALHRVDEAAACFKWAIDVHERGAGIVADASSSGTGGALAGGLTRDLHLYGYSLYEVAILHSNGVKALARQAARATASTATTTASAADAAGRTTGGADVDTAILSSDLLRGLDAGAMREQAKALTQAAKGIKDDFNWKMRMHLRIHLMHDEMRTRPRKHRDVSADGAAAAGGASGGSSSGTMSAADFEATLLAKAIAPMGSGGAGEADSDDE